MPDEKTNSKPKRLPSVNTLMMAMSSSLIAFGGHSLAVEMAQKTLAVAREEWQAEGTLPTLDELARRSNALLTREIIRPPLQPAINATGIILHTGLGRAVIAPEATPVALHGGHCVLEVDLETGERGSRQEHVAPLLCAITGAEAALAVNNDAGAVLLALAAIGRGRDVIVSRGELVEIGGGFRIPEILAESGATMVEVGTTNKTRLRDYERAITPNTAALLKVHPSNFRVVGFTETTGIRELSELAGKHGLPLLDDLGTGALLDLGFGEPTVQERLAQGSDLVMFSGDKLLGGPQAGIAVGRRDLIDKMAVHPLARALRCDKLTLSCLQRTLVLYRRGGAQKSIPTLIELATPPDELKASAERLADMLSDIDSLHAEVVESDCRVGSGALPDYPIPSFAVSIDVAGMGPNALAKALRLNETPIFAHIANDTVLLEVRTMYRFGDPAHYTTILRALKRIVGEMKEGKK
ncbi:MAG TPA: L-seryl-tRNA(Sec) selenium transferase [Armatimonadota bacterium]|jgi:L-seryl-tRNA(Ser) seleniumtransferase